MRFDTVVNNTNIILLFSLLLSVSISICHSAIPSSFVGSFSATSSLSSSLSLILILVLFLFRKSSTLTHFSNIHLLDKKSLFCLVDVLFVRSKYENSFVLSTLVRLPSIYQNLSEKKQERIPLACTNTQAKSLLELDGIPRRSGYQKIIFHVIDVQLTII